MPTSPANRGMKQYSKELVLLLAIPATLVIVVLAVSYVPRLFANPGYSFIYSVCESYTCGTSVSIDENGTLSEKPTKATSELQREPLTLYFYDTTNDSYRPISSEQAADYKLSAASRAPDDYALEYNRTEGGFLFWGESTSQWRLTKGWISQPVTLSNNQSNYSDNVSLVGWVLP